MESTPKISIIVPVYKVEPYLHRCVDSLLNQTYRNLEIILVDDGSPDNCPQICDDYAEKDDRVVVIHQENAGQSSARNAGLDIMTGEYIMFVDSDDWVEPETCTEALSASEKFDADVVMWDYIRERPNASKKKGIFKEDVIFEEPTVKDRLYYRMIGLLDSELARPEMADALAPIWGKLYRRECVEREHIRVYDIRKVGAYEDGLFNLDVFKGAKKVIYLNQFFYHYRKDIDGATTTTYRERLPEQWEHLFDYLEHYIQINELKEDASSRLSNRVVLSILGLGLNLLADSENVWVKIKKLKKILSSKRYRRAFKRVPLNYFPMHWKIFYGFAKYNFATGVYIILVCIKKLKGRG